MLRNSAIATVAGLLVASGAYATQGWDFHTAVVQVGFYQGGSVCAISNLTGGTINIFIKQVDENGNEVARRGSEPLGAYKTATLETTRLGKLRCKFSSSSASIRARIYVRDSLGGLGSSFDGSEAWQVVNDN